MLIPPDPGEAAALEAALATGQRRRPRVRLLVDWDRDGTWDHSLSDLGPWLRDWATDSFATGDLPSEATTVEGAVASEFTFTLRGENADGLHVMDVFGAYQEGSPLFQGPVFGTPCTFDVGFHGAPWTRVFTGQIRGISPDSTSRSVRFSALDPAELLRAHITLPPCGMWRNHWLSADHRFYINTQWVVDHILRANGVYASPPPHENAQIVVTAHGSHAAEVGRNTAPGQVADLPAGPIPDGEDSWWIAGPPQFGGALAARGFFDDTHGSGWAYWTQDSGYQLSGGHGVGVAAWVKVGTDMPQDTTDSHKFLFAWQPMADSDDIELILAVRASDAGLSGRVYVNNSFVDGATRGQTDTNDWRYYGLHWAHRQDGTTLISYRMDGTTEVFTVDTPQPTTSYAPRPRLFAFNTVPWSDLQVWFAPERPTGDWPGETHTSQATLGVGVNELAYMPDVMNAESLPLLTEVVQSEYALAGFDESGQFEFRPRSTVDPSTVDLEVTVDGSLMDLIAEMSSDTIRNAIGITTADGFFTFQASIVRSTEEREFESDVGVTRHQVRLTGEMMAAPELDVPHILESNLADDHLYFHGFVAVRSDDPETEVPPGTGEGINVKFTATGPRTAELTVRNYTQFPVRFATTTGQPAMRVRGFVLNRRPPIVEQFDAPGSAELYGERLYGLRESEWRQRPEPMREVAGGLLATLSNPLPALRNVQIMGDPRIQKGDVLRLRDPKGQGTFRVYVVGVAHRGAPGSEYTTNLTVRPVAPPGLGIFDDTELGLLDSTLIAAP